MAYYLYRIILIALVLTIAVPSSLGHFGVYQYPPPIQPGEFDCYNHLRALCSQTNHTEECWTLIKPQFRRFNKTDETGVLGVAPIAADLVKEKAFQFQDQFYKLFDGSKDRNLKFKYISCSNIYNDATIHLELVKMSFSGYKYDDSLVQIHDLGEDLKRCVSKFTENSSDPALTTNKVFGVYVEFLKAAAINWADLRRRN